MMNGPSRRWARGMVMEKIYDPPLDKGIEREVMILNDAGIETYESCEGGKGHAYTEPTICFHGDRTEGFKAVAIAIQCALKVSAIKRFWSVIESEPTGPKWEMTFFKRSQQAVK